MAMLFRTYAIYQPTQNFESFYMNFPNQAIVDFFGSRVTEVYPTIMKEEFNILAMSSLDIVEGWD